MFSLKLFRPVWKSKKEETSPEETAKPEKLSDSVTGEYTWTLRFLKECVTVLYGSEILNYTKKKGQEKNSKCHLVYLNKAHLFLKHSWLVLFNMPLIMSRKWGTLVQQPSQIDMGFRPLPFIVFKMYQCVWDFEIRKRTWKLKYSPNKCRHSCRRINLSSPSFSKRLLTTKR